MKPTAIAAGFIAASALSFGAGAAITEISPSDELEKKHAIMADYIWLNARLSEQPTIDISAATVEEWSQAYIDAAEKYGIPLVDATEPTDINLVMRDKASELEQLCADPTATKGEVRK